MRILRLACRVYRINPIIERDVRSILIDSQVNKPLHFETYSRGEIEYDLSIVIKDRLKNNYGREISLWVDHVTTLRDRENEEQIVRYYKEHQIQLIEGVQNFNNHIIIFGPKEIDRSIMKAIKYSIGETGVSEPFVIVKVDFRANIDALTKEFPNLQHFCITDIPDERTKRLVVRGNSLEETDLFDRFAVDEETSGPVNFLGITTEFGKLIYIGTDGSVYSRMSFAREDNVKIVFDLYLRFKKIGVLVKPLEDF